nr:aspartyl protease AED3-like [Ipomoea batatas]
MKAILLLSLALAVLFTVGQCSGRGNCKVEEKGSTLQVLHVYSSCSPFRPSGSSSSLSWEESVLQMQTKDEARLEYLSSLVAGKSAVPIASGRQMMQSPTYIVRAKIGTPPQTLLLAMDTSSDAAWIPCTGCAGCPASAHFSPPKSTTFKNVSCGAPQCHLMPKSTCEGGACSFNVTYGVSTIAGNLSQDTVTLATDAVPGYTFGCVRRATGSSMPPQGLLGLGRGPLSLLSQTQSLYKSTFSYCLPSFKSPNFAGSLRLGPTGQPLRIKLVEPAYAAVRNEFQRRMGKNTTVTSLGGFDTCYTVPVTVPTITFMFQGMNVTLPQDNFLIHSTAGSTTCLAMAAAPDNVNSVLNVIANMQQQNHRILFDVPNSRLGVARELCS